MGHGRRSRVHGARSRGPIPGPPPPPAPQHHRPPPPPSTRAASLLQSDPPVPDLQTQADAWLDKLAKAKKAGERVTERRFSVIWCVGEALPGRAGGLAGIEGGRACAGVHGRVRLCMAAWAGAGACGRYVRRRLPSAEHERAHTYKLGLTKY
jgi:hypothetical protein